MPGVRSKTAVAAPSQLNLFTDAVEVSVVLVALINPRDFKLNTASLSHPEKQRHRWLTDRLASQGFQVIRHTFHPAEIVHPWESEETPEGTVIYRQWPKPD